MKRDQMTNPENGLRAKMMIIVFNCIPNPMIIIGYLGLWCLTPLSTIVQIYRGGL